MTSFIQNMLWNSVSGFVEAGTRTVGGYAGDALIKAGDMVEGGGRAVGNSIERKATGIGSSISGQPHSPSAKALPSTARRPAAHRSNSLPPSSKPSTGGSGVPLGGKKYGAGSVGAAKNGAKSAVGGVTSGVARGAGGMSKPVGGVVGRANSTAGALGRGLGGAGGSTANSAAKRNTLPRPYPQGPAPQGKAVGLSKPYGNTNSYPSTDKKTAVRPGQSKPFTTPPQQKDEQKKPYPGTNTLPGQGNKVPVKKYKPAQRYQPPAKAGEATFF